jgi:hypothetical protein
MTDIVLTDAAGRITPRNAQMGKKIYFWHNPRTDHIYQGAGPQFDSFMPPGYERITCNHAWEAERWSQRLRDQEKRIAEATDYERELIEGPMRVDLRAELNKKIKEARNGVNRRLLEVSLQKLNELEAKGKAVRESWLHVEAYTHGN